MNKNLLTLLAVASIGLCGSFTTARSNNPARMVTARANAFALSPLQVHAMTLNRFSVNINGINESVNPELIGNKITARHRSTPVHEKTIYLEARNNWRYFGTGEYTEPAITVKIGDAHVSGKTQVTKSGSGLTFKFNGRTADGRNVTIDYVILT